jgi:serine/threonine protein kinase
MDLDITARLPRRRNRPAAGDVRLIREIGRGGVGVVYAGWHDGRDAPCAVKFLLDPEVASADRLARFEREARLCIEIEEPALVRVYETGRAGGLPYFVMEWVPGNGLDVVAAAVGRLTESEVMTVLRDVGQALFGLHSRGIVHRDVKPSNLLLRATDGRLKVADLGMAKRVGAADAIRTVEIIGTPSYMSPEQVRDSAGVGPASDYFSLGSTAYALLTGRHPFDADNPYDSMRLVCETPLPRPPADEVRVSDALWRVIERLTVKDPAARVQTAGELMDLLPGVSAPFRPAVLDAARPGFDVTPPDDSGLVPTLSLPSARGSAAYTAEFMAPPPTGRRDALLFCQCLQNDYLAPPDGPDWEPPNLLHVGRSEALRVVGADPHAGPLVRAVAACAEADHVRVTHIRDWHDADDPRQRAELDHFGEHCLMGTWGARFIDAIEAYSRDRRRAAVVDAGGINDFHDTPILEMIDAVAAAAPDPAAWRAETPVGVVGTWTDVKVHYLLYDLKTRAGLRNLATCSALVASPEPAAQAATLRHLGIALGVRVFDEVDEFLRFLGVEPSPGQ